MAFSPNAETVYADGPFGSPLQPSKPEIRSLLAQYEAAIDAYSSGAGSIAKSTRALLFADLAHAADVTAWVYADSTVAYNGIYRKSGASGAGSWALILPLPFSFIIASDVGAGTPNAIQATTSIPVSSSALVWMNIFEANTASPVTVSFNGGSALTIKTNSGNDVAAGGLTAGMIVMGIVSGSTFRLVSDQASSAIVAAAEAFAELSKSYADTSDVSRVWANKWAEQAVDSPVGSNLLQYSEQFDNAYWSKTRASIVSNAATAPDGTLTADKLVEDTTANNTHNVGRNFTPIADTEYTFSCFVKAGERTFAAVQIGGFGNQVLSNAVFVNLVTGEFACNTPSRAKVESWGNGWWRVSSTIRTKASGLSGAIVPSVYPSTDLLPTGTSYTGNGTSGIYIWGAHFEQAPFASVYVPTTTAAVDTYSAKHWAGQAVAAAASANIRYAATRTALKAFNTASTPLAFLSEGGRNGLYEWTAGDFSSQIAADTAEGIYIKADAIAATAGAWVRVAASDVSAFGASATVNSSADIHAMATLLGYVRFPAGNTLVGSNLTIDVPVYFADGAYVTVAAARTLTITNVIDSPKQHIFRGDGLVVLNHDADTGEPSRQIHISWFGAFPGEDDVDQAPAIQKAFTALGNARESKVQFDIGNYTMMTGVTVTRGGWVLGSGNRRTVFLVKGDGFDVFNTGHTACRFSDIQFENHSDNVSARISPFIRISHDFCLIENVYAQEAFNQIIVEMAGNNCTIREFNMVWRTYPFTAGSAGILVRGSGCNISGIFSNFSSGGGPEALIAVGTGAGANVSATYINNVSYISASIGVLIHGDSVIISRGQITGINYRGGSGSAPQAVKFLTSGTGGIFGFTVDVVTVNGTATADLTFQCNGSGDLKQITVDNLFSSGSSGNGIEFIRTAGILSDIVIGATVNVRKRTNPVFFSGSNSDIRIDPRVMVGGDVAGVYFRGSVADDTAFSIALGRSIFSGTAIITAGVAERGIFGIRAAPTPAVGPNWVTDANVVAVATTLVGTTGTDGNLTLGVQDGVLYVENRTGSAQNISLCVMGA